MRIRVKALGTLRRGLPGGQDFFEGEELSIGEVLDALASRYGEILTEELYEGEKLREGLAILVNGRNVLSLPEGLLTALDDGDEILITAVVPGG